MFSLVLLTLFFNFFQLISQELSPVFENITDGLPSTEVYDIFQDSIGYMWFATDRGICRYEGENFKVVETSKDLESNIVFKFFKQSETCVWLATGDGQLYKFNPFDGNPQFIAFKKNKELLLLKNYEHFSLNFSEMQFGSDTAYVFSRSLPGYICLTDDKVEYVNQSNRLGNSSFNIEVQAVNNHYYTILKQSGSSHGNYLNFFGYRVPLPFDDKVNKYFNYGVSSFINEDSIQLLAISDKLICHKNGIAEHVQLPSVILSVVSIDGEFFIGTFDGVFVLNEKLKIINHFLKGEIVSKLFKNDSKILWVGTIQNGVYLCNDLRIDEMKFSDKRSVTEVSKTNSFLGLYNNVFRDVIYLNSELETSGIIQDVYITYYKIMSTSSNISKFIGEERQYKTSNKDDLVSKYLLAKYDNSDFVFSDDILYKINHQKITPYYYLDEKIMGKFSCQIDNSTVIIGSKKGLFDFNTEKKKCAKFQSKKTKNSEINAYSIFGDSFLFTSKIGVFQLQGKEFKILENSEGIDLKNFSVSEDDFVFTHSDNNVYRIYEVSGELKFEKFEFHVAKSELFILSVEVFNNQLWVATKKGLFVMDLKRDNKMNESEFYTFHIDSLIVGNKKGDINSDIEILPENGFKMYFNIITYYKNDRRKLEYSIDSDNWFEMNKNSLSIANLASGEYSLKIRSIDSPEKIIFSKKVTVLKHFYQTGVFFILFTIVLALVGFFVLKKILQIKERKNKEELEKLNLELKLLTSKMNPHFTFNTINSIQHSIMKSDKKNAIQYLSEFALLMRKSLDFSMAERILLHEEKEFVELYVKMENKRFNSNFVLQFDIESDLVTCSKKIPSMLIQPLVENVILHADYKDDEEKIIQVGISFDKDYFLIKVIDYGVGKTEQNAQLGNHKSYGLEILRSRVKMYNGKEYKDENVNIGFTFPNEKKGTTVTIKLKEWKR